MWILVPVLFWPPLTAAYSLNQEDRFEATALVLLSDSASQEILDPSSQNTSFLSRELANEISRAERDEVVSLVISELGELPDVDISSDNEADLLVFVGRASDPTEAALHANTWAEKYIQVKREAAIKDITEATVSIKERLVELRQERQELRAPLDQLDDRIQRNDDPDVATTLQREYDRLADDLRYELELITSQAAAAVDSLTDLELQAKGTQVGEIVQDAVPPRTRSNAPLSQNIALGLALGLLTGSILALMAEARDKTIKSAADIASFSDIPVLASIPRASKKQQMGLPFATYSDPEGKYAEAYHKVRSSLEFASLEQSIKTVLVTSPNPSEGKSTTSANLALALSSVGKRTILLDVDYRRATIDRIFGIEQSPGMSDVVLNGADIRSVAYSIEEPGLKDVLVVVPTGTLPPRPAAFVATNGYLSNLDMLRDQADVVVMDAPPLLAVSDAHTLGKHVDAVILTAKAGETTKGELGEVIAVLSQTGANVIGIVLIGVDEAEAYGRQYYHRSPDNSNRLISSGERATQSLWVDRLDAEDKVIDVREAVSSTAGR